MTALFEQHSTASIVPNAVTFSSDQTAQRVDSEPEGPIFKKMKIEFSPKEVLTHLVVSNDVLVMGLMDKSFVRVNLRNPGEPEFFSLSTQLTGSVSQYRMHRVFLDPLGNHLIISVLQCGLDEGENFYIYLGGNIGSKRTACRILRGSLITAVAFNPDNRQNTSTGSILVGTFEGVILELELSAPADIEWRFGSRSASSEKCCKQIYQMRDKLTINGLHLELISSPAGGQPQAVIFVSTSRYLYTFFGPAIPSADLQTTFSSVFSSSEAWAYNNSRELQNNSKHSVLRVFTPKGVSSPTHLACLFGAAGILHGDLTVSTKNDKLADGPWLRFYEEPEILELDQARTGEGQPLQQPVAMAVTNYHLLVLFGDRMRAFSQLDHSLVMEDAFPQGRMVGLARDCISGSTWAFSETTVYRYRMEKEDRHMWKILLKKKKYDKAKLFCKGDAQKLNKIRLRHAQDLFKQGEYERSAKMFGDTSSSFEEVSLRFLEVDQDAALRVLIKQKIRSLANLIISGKDTSQKTQLTMLVTWLLQLYLNRLGQLKQQFARPTDVSCHSSDLQKSEYLTLERELREMLTSNTTREIIQTNRKSFYKLIANHGDEEFLLEFFDLIGDYERVIQQYLQQRLYQKALDVLVKQGNPELYYAFSPELMGQLPEQLVDCWLNESSLNPVKLIPALVQLSDDFCITATFVGSKLLDQPNMNPLPEAQIAQSIRYLEHCVKKDSCIDESIHNYLIALYARYGHKERLEEYLKSQGDDVSKIAYDAKYALRVFSEFGLFEACMHVYVVMELFSEALELALDKLGDIEQAQLIADRPASREERKKLWLVIASHVIRSEGQNVGSAMRLLEKCSGLLRIEDVLPFFPDFVCIDDFKDAICESLQTYKSTISELRESMGAATQATNQIREEIMDVRNRCFVVERTDKCDSCGFGLLSQAFFIFPCLHKFHAECLRVVHKNMPFSAEADNVVDQQQQKNSELQDSLADKCNVRDRAASNSSVPVGVVHKSACAESADELYMQECVYCGELMADSVGIPFFEAEDYEALLRQWV